MIDAISRPKSPEVCRDDRLGRLYDKDGKEGDRFNSKGGAKANPLLALQLGGYAYDRDWLRQKTADFSSAPYPRRL
ncbi:MAG: hypothetical protein F6J93_20790 [Oscillatoria sp. SIO1A7]|nr:hypothetical protein [Oscillatoria sp. SIO1A7]